MAESMVSFVLDHLSQVIAHEAGLLCGVENKIKSLQNELQMINEFLKTSKARKDIEKIVVSQIRDVAHEAEDVIDTGPAQQEKHAGDSKRYLRPVEVSKRVASMIFSEISAYRKAKRFKVCTDNSILIPTKPRRLSIHCNRGHYISSSNNDHSCIRSLFFFDVVLFVIHEELKWFFKSFKSYRMLHFGTLCCRNDPF
ncbi:putative disease resistance protein, partial [Mucuna pruriens]